MKNNNRRDSGLLALAALVPAAISLAIAVPMLWIIWPDLSPRQIDSVISLLLLTHGLAFGMGLISAWLWLRRKDLPISLLIVTAPAQFAAFYIQLRWLNVPPPRGWMFDEDAFMTLVLSGIIPLFYTSLLLLATRFSIHNRRGLFISAAGSIGIPLCIYALFQLMRYARGGSGADAMLIVVLASLTIAFSFLVLRLLLFLIQRRAGWLTTTRGRFSLRLTFIGLLPLLGLLMNTIGPVARESRTVLGDFTGLPFWLLAVVNALVYLLPLGRNLFANALLVVLRGVGLCFVVYFCVVFLLYLPLALLLIAALGLGLLLLIPYFTLGIQWIILREDYTQWRENSRAWLFPVLLAGGFLLLPCTLLADMLLQRSQLIAAVAYVQHPPLTLNHDADFNRSRIESLLAEPRRQSRGWLDQRESIPLYDTLRQQVVYDGVGLAAGMRQRLRHIFLGEENAETSASNTLPEGRVGAVTLSARQDGNVTYTDLRIQLENPDARREAELDVRVALPDNAFLAGHWLVIGQVEQPAQITSRSAAIWTYNRITEQRRDPSLIWYESKNRLRWRLFPIPANGRREARLQIAHLGQADLRLGSQSVRLHGKEKTAETNAVLPAQAPRPYLQFIVDCGNKGMRDYSSLVQAVAQATRIPLSGARISFVNASIRTIDLQSVSDARCEPAREGFFADLAFRALMAEKNRAASSGFPVFVVLSATLPGANWSDISYFTRDYRDMDFFIHADGKGLHAYDFYGNRTRLPGFSNGVTSQRRQRAQPAGMEKFLHGQELYERWLRGENPARHEAIRTAMHTGILNPAAASIVLETEAQRRKLAEMNQRTLKSQHELETGNRMRMSEPTTALLLLLLLPFLVRRLGGGNSLKKNDLSG
ncbi:MAG TPA: MSEP-CTERM sorting domain-containing protein [Turneriella sp.]|nr:MSEP-CTERM sorting domain-containing protein [Turneriella sp.]